MTNTQRMKVHVYHNATANTLFTREEALMLQLLCTALDQRDAFVYTMEFRAGSANWYLTRASNGVMSSAYQHLTHDHTWVVTRKVKNTGRQRQMYVTRKTLTQRRPEETIHASQAGLE